jgi:transketolase
MSLRLIPHLTVLRPADANETAEAWRIAIESRMATALILSRQDLAILDRSNARGDVARGGYILAESNGAPDVVLLATGSEVELAVLAQGQLQEMGVSARVVSMPSWELFELQDEDWKAEVLGPEGTPRVSVEAGTTLGWARYTGARGAHVGIDTYGASGPGKAVLKHFGMTKEHVAAVALRLLGRTEEGDVLDAEYVAGQEAAGKPASGADGHS